MAGAEGPGLSGAAWSAADETVRIPVDARSDSLNVVVAVSIALERLCRFRPVE
jgi:tRNA G18 (ribose-2'-O)-methylase SpoU